MADEYFPKIDEAEFWRRFKLISENIYQAIYYYNYWKAMNNELLIDEDAQRKLNVIEKFWRTSRKAFFDSHILAIHRLFDDNSDAYTVHCLLRDVRNHPEFFSLDALRQRKIELWTSDEELLNEYLKDAYEPTAKDLSNLKLRIRAASSSVIETYAEMRHSKLAHTFLISENQNINVYKTESLLARLYELMQNIEQMAINGREPEWNSETYNHFSGSLHVQFQQIIHQLKDPSELK